MSRTLPQSLLDLARDLVIRARAHDQNAMGLLHEIGKMARDKANPRVIQVSALVDEYIKKHPYDGTPKLPKTSQQSLISGEEARDYVDTLRRHCGEDRQDLGLAIISLSPNMGDFAIVTLCDSVPLLGKEGNTTIDSIAAEFGSEKEKQAFLVGLKNSQKAQKLLALASKLKGNVLRALGIGSMVGQARRMQAVAKTKAPISVLSTVAGWEHGE